MIQCRGCGLTLGDEDNYCRRCGAAVRVVEITTARSEPLTLPSPQAVIAATAAPLATGVAAIAAGAIVRFAVKQAVRALVSGSGRAAVRGLTTTTPRAAVPREPEAPAPPAVPTQITEVFWYRRIVR